MKNVLIKIKRVIERLKAFIPTTLPQGVSEFNTWADSVLDLAGMPNNDSTKFTLATMIPHLDGTTSNKPKEYFIRSLRKAASNQVAYFIIQDLKAKQMAKQEEEKKALEAKSAEVTANVLAVVSDDRPQV